MSKRNELINEHYRLNYTKLVKKTQRRVPYQSITLAEEVVQEAYSRAIKYFRTFNPVINNFDIWFSRILRNATNDCRTRESDHGLNKEYDSNTEDIRVNKIERENIALIKQEINSNQNHKEILMNFFIYSLNSKEVSELLGIKDGTIRQVVSRFRKRINEIYNRDN